MEDGFKLGPGESLLENMTGGYFNVQYRPIGSDKIVYLGEAKGKDVAFDWIAEAHIEDDGTPEYADRLIEKVTYKRD